QHDVRRCILFASSRWPTAEEPHGHGRGAPEQRPWRTSSRAVVSSSSSPSWLTASSSSCPAEKDLRAAAMAGECRLAAEEELQAVALVEELRAAMEKHLRAAAMADLLMVPVKRGRGEAPQGFTPPSGCDHDGGSSELPWRRSSGRWPWLYLR
ncbi:unnamed protein product, partial [Urochloa humidicola]